MVGFFLLIVIPHQIALYAIDDLDACVLGSRHGIRKGLHAAVVSDGDRIPAPLGCGLNQCLGRGHRIHGAHVGMAMQLHSFFGGIVLSGLPVHQHQCLRHNAIIIGIGIIADRPPHLHHASCLGSRLQPTQHSLVAIVVTDKHLAADALGGISQGKQQHIGIGKLLAVHTGNIALCHHGAHLTLQLADRRQLPYDAITEDNRRIIRTDGQLLTAIPLAAIAVAAIAAVTAMGGIT